MRISYGRVRGSGYNTRTGNNIAICPGGKKKKNFILEQLQYIQNSNIGLRKPLKIRGKYYVILNFWDRNDCDDRHSFALITLTVIVTPVLRS